MQQLLTLDVNGRALGVVLISSASVCKLCSGKLQVRSDRPSQVTLYTDEMSTFPAPHYHKYCQNSRKGCSFNHYYGYSTTIHGLTYDNNWSSLPYFLSSQVTGFDLAVMRRLDAEILIGQISYYQFADVYNYLHDPKKNVFTSVDR